MPDKRTAERIAAGLCIKCASPAAAGIQLCEPCQTKRKAKEKAAGERKRAKADALGLCRKCRKNKAPAPGRQCEICRAKSRARYLGEPIPDPPSKKPKAKRNQAAAYMRDWDRARTAKRIAAGVCVKCGRRPPIEGKRICQPCKAERKRIDAQAYARRKARAAERGLCFGCIKNKAPPTGNYCNACKAKRLPYQHARARRLFEAGLCMQCGETNDRHPHRKICAECSAYAVAGNRRRAERGALPPPKPKIKYPPGQCAECGIRLRAGNETGRCSAHQIDPHLSISTRFDEEPPDDYIPGLDDDDDQLASLRMSPEAPDYDSASLKSSV